jgi:hypothetical protein
MIRLAAGLPSPMLANDETVRRVVWRRDDGKLLQDSLLPPLGAMQAWIDSYAASYTVYEVTADRGEVPVARFGWPPGGGVTVTALAPTGEARPPQEETG